MGHEKGAVHCDTDAYLLGLTGDVSACGVGGDGQGCTRVMYTLFEGRQERDGIRAWMQQRPPGISGGPIFVMGKRPRLSWPMEFSPCQMGSMRRPNEQFASSWKCLGNSYWIATLSAIYNGPTIVGTCSFVVPHKLKTPLLDPNSS